ncbi:mucin-5AC-like [Lepisosteus oculatus]|uniref:mucin-5AC-like n=1 Tax=Lepisosteus oculatus TaxID=7918 RepID=UPI003713F216
MSVTTSNKITDSDQIEASVQYNLQSSDLQSPSDFVIQILKIRAQATTTPKPSVPTTRVTPSISLDSVLAVLNLEFNTTSPPPSESDILTVFNHLLAPILSLGIYPVTITDITVKNTTGKGFAVTVDLRISNLTIPAGSQLTNETYSKLQDTINNVVQDILSKTLGGQPSHYPTSKFLNESDHIQAEVVCNLQSSEVQSPSGVLTELLNMTGHVNSITATLTINGQPTPTTPAPFTSKSPVPSSRNRLVLALLTLQFNTSNSPPTATEIKRAMMETFPALNLQETYAVDITNITSEKRNLLQVTNATFSTDSDQIEASVQYSLQSSDLQSPSDFVIQILKIRAQPTTKPEPPVPTTRVTPSISLDSVLAVLNLEFNTTSPPPSESDILTVFNHLLAPILSLGIYPVTITDITVKNTTGKGFAVTVDLRISNLTIPAGSQLTNETYSKLQDTINNVVQDILSKTLGGQPSHYPTSKFLNESDHIQAEVVCNLQSSEVQSPSGVLTELLNMTGHVNSITATLTINGEDKGSYRANFWKLG